MLFALAAAAAAVSLSMAVYLISRFRRFSAVQRLAGSRPALSWLIALVPFAAVCLFAVINISTLLVVMLHLCIAFLLCGFAAFIFRIITGKRPGYDLVGSAAILLTALYLAAGWFCAHHVFQTEYSVSSSKPLDGDIRIIEIADAHLGITLDGKGFARQLERMQRLSPDVLVITGDFVDDDSALADMTEACRALGSFDAPMGIYFVFGNHDGGYMDRRDFTAAQLLSELESNGVTVLRDESVLIDGSFYIVGRRDRSQRNRADASSLLAGLDKGKYIVMLDHQPNDQANEAAAGADLVLSGHTHGGHIFPAGQIGLLAHANDQRYGMRSENGTVFIVSSGISGWAIPFKTGTRSEFVVIDISNG